MANTKKVTGRVSLQGSCEVITTVGMECPLCHTQIPPDTCHECQVNDGVKTIRNSPVKDQSEMVD